MQVIPFMLAVFCGRMVRWLLLSLLVLKLGPGAVGIVAHHGPTVGAVVGVLAIGAFAWWWMRKKRAGSCWKINERLQNSAQSSSFSISARSKRQALPGNSNGSAGRGSSRPAA